MRTILLFLLALNFSFSALAEKLVEAEFILPRAYATPGQVRQVIIKVNIKKDWHIYWRNPGESGLAPDFTWHGDNYEIKKIHWPTPKAYEKSGIINNIYDGEVLFIADLLVKPGTKDGKIIISADIDFLACKDACIMQSVKLSQTIVVDSKNRIETMQIHPLLSKAMDLMPRRMQNKVDKQVGKSFNLTLPKNSHNKTFYFAFVEDGIVMKNKSQTDKNLVFESNDKSALKGLLISNGQAWIID
jgi:DsbC/DsbD-like thiol-disulfide interchange protein